MPNYNIIMRIAVIGDIHGFWDAADTHYFNHSDYDVILFVGDLPRLTGGLDVAREISRLQKPAWFIPGNHDGCTALQLLSEIKGWKRLCGLTAQGMAGRVSKLASALGDVRLCAYEQFDLADGLGLVAARPHAMGPDRFYYANHTQRRYGVNSFATSATKLKALVDASPKNIVFLAHNGPSGLGDRAEDLWGCDFSPDYGDFGDPDLRAAIDYANTSGHQVLAVLAGHMHLRSKTGGRRSPAKLQDGCLYINAAEVARIRSGGARRHHVQLIIYSKTVQAKQMWVSPEGRLLEELPLP